MIVRDPAAMRGFLFFVTEEKAKANCPEHFLFKSPEKFKLPGYKPKEYQQYLVGRKNDYDVKRVVHPRGKCFFSNAYSAKYGFRNV